MRRVVCVCASKVLVVKKTFPEKKNETREEVAFPTTFKIIEKTTDDDDDDDDDRKPQRTEQRRVWVCDFKGEQTT